MQYHTRERTCTLHSTHISCVESCTHCSTNYDIVQHGSIVGPEFCRSTSASRCVHPKAACKEPGNPQISLEICSVGVPREGARSRLRNKAPSWSS